MEQSGLILGQIFAEWMAGLVAVLVLLALIGFIYQTVATKRDERIYPPPGRLVDIGGFRLHLYGSGPASIEARGEAGPAVILDAGLGDCSLTWSLVQPEIAKFAPV